MTKKRRRAGRGNRQEEEFGADGEMGDRGFDLFLNRQLHQLYDPVLAEPIPDEMLRLLEQFPDRPQAGSDPERGESGGDTKIDET